MTKELKGFKGRSLPPEPLDAQRLYQQWLTDLAQSKGFEQVKVTPENRVSRGTVYVAVQVSVSGQATTDELTDFLVSFYRVGLLQRIARLELSGSGRTASSPLIVTLLAEGLCLLDTPDRDTLFRQTTLVAEVDADAKQLNLENIDLLPEDLPAQIQIGEERLDVTWAEGSIVEVTRGVDSTDPARHAAGAAVQILPKSPVDTEAATLAAQDILDAHPFALPSVFEPQFRATGAVAVLRTAEEWSLDVSLTGDNPSLAKPTYSLVFSGESQPSGLSIEENGVLRWNDRTEVELGSYEVEVVARRPGEEPLRNRLTLELTDPPTETAEEDPARDMILVGAGRSARSEHRPSTSFRARQPFRFGSGNRWLALSPAERQVGRFGRHCSPQFVDRRPACPLRQQYCVVTYCCIKTCTLFGARGIFEKNLRIERGFLDWRVRL